METTKKTVDEIISCYFDGKAEDPEPEESKLPPRAVVREKMR